MPAYFFEVAYFFSNAYKYIAILLLIAGLFNYFKKEPYNLLYTACTLLAWVYLFYTLVIGYDFYIGWYGQNNYERWIFIEGSSIGYRFYWYKVAAAFLLGLFFFIRKLRTSVIYIVIFIVIQNIGLIEEIFFPTPAFVLPYPKKWITIDSFFKQAALFLVTIILLVFIYWRAKKKNRLPYPSVFLK